MNGLNSDVNFASYCIKVKFWFNIGRATLGQNVDVNIWRGTLSPSWGKSLLSWAQSIELVPQVRSVYDWRSVSQSVLVSNPIWGSWPDINFVKKVTVLSIGGVLSDERSGLYLQTPVPAPSTSTSTNHLRELRQNIGIIKALHVRGLTPEDYQDKNNDWRDEILCMVPTQEKQIFLLNSAAGT
jgi:hypothetical protein